MSTAAAITTKYFPFGDCRNSQGSPGTDRLFTGQRLDGTGLYFYNARYYDPEIGRFISADATVPGPSTPQSLNRYSYCVNNPLKLVDPSGLDYLLVGESNSTEDEMNTWKKQLEDSGALKDGEQVYIIGDNDTEAIPAVGCDIDPRISQIDQWLSNPPTGTDSNGNAIKVTDLKIVGHSKGRRL